MRLGKATDKPLISVGGILSSENALERLSAGADLIQIYTGWIYQGPFFACELDRAIRKPFV
jgi:dihydroorotate dehydrogenase